MFSTMDKTNLVPVSISGLPTKEFIQPRMNVDDENTEPVTDLGLALGYSNPCIQRQLNNDSGAGANAGSRIDMTFVAPDPLSELVWSPQKGLCLKCADSSFADKKASLLWGAGPSNAAFLMPQSTADGRSDTDNPMVEEVMIPQVAFHAKDDFAGTNTSTGSPTSDAGSMSGCGPNYEHDTGKEKVFQVKLWASERLGLVFGLNVASLKKKKDYEKVSNCIIMSVNLSISIISIYKTIHINFYDLPSKSGDFCLAGSVGNVEELNTAEGLSVIHVTQNEDQRKSEGDEICAQINIQMVEIETRENNLSSLPGACCYL